MRARSQFFTCESTVCFGNYPAHFGEGTKLTVLEAGLNITEPAVKVFEPSPKECKNQKDRKRKKTIVCVASGFYPDHVHVFWKIDGEIFTEGVATDNTAVRDGNYYKITSRLRISAKSWYTPGKTFSCFVSFYNGENTTYHDASVFSVQGKGEEKYLRITQAAKLSYSVFIAKSSIYGAFIAFLVWKLQVSTGKQSN